MIKRMWLLVFVLLAGATAWVSSETFGFSYLDMANVMKAATRRNDVLLLGNSVIKTVSKCDTDSRTVAEMLSADMGRPVLDLSRGGMQLDEALAMVRASTRWQSGRVIVLPLAVADQLLKEKPPKIGRHAWSAHMLGQKPTEQESAPEYYKGIRYGSYADFSIKHFTMEKKATECPEVKVHDPNFVEFMYWLNFSRQKDFSSDKGKWLAEMRAVQASGHRLLVPIFPYHRSMVEHYFGASEVLRIDREIQSIVVFLRSSGIEVLDLSRVLIARDFSDIWCACGHLNESGRLKVSVALGKALSEGVAGKR